MTGNIMLEKVELIEKYMILIILYSVCLKFQTIYIVQEQINFDGRVIFHDLRTISDKNFAVTAFAEAVIMNKNVIDLVIEDNKSQIA